MAPLQAPVVRHICSSRKSALLPKAAKEPASKNLFKTRQSLNKTAFLYRDSLKNPKPNTDGIVNCLLQPGQLRNQLYKSMLSTSIHLLTFVYPD
jgi:hypothetical protein